VSERIDVATLSAGWLAIGASIGALKVPSNEREYNATVAQLDALLDLTHGDREHSLSGLVELVGDLIAVYESRNLKEPSASPAEVLSLLMTENGLKQADLAKELGGQSVVSQLLNGKREFNAKQARALADRFGVSPALFIAESSSTDASTADSRASVLQRNESGQMSPPFVPLVAGNALVNYRSVRAVLIVSTGQGEDFYDRQRIVDVGIASTLSSTASEGVQIVKILKGANPWHPHHPTH
jgi:HTH-type transcriptional regulator/antitoxin HigA